MLAFTDTKVTKPELIRVLEAHQMADELVQGQYFEDGKGCAVGCSLHSFNESSSDHSAYEPLFGIPQVLARLEDKIFEGLSIDKAKEWPLKFTNAVKEGSDLSGVYPLFQVWVLTDKDHGVIRFAKTDEQRKVIQDAANLFTAWPNIDKEKALAVRKEALQIRRAADAAAAAADAAAYAAAAAAYAAAAAADADADAAAAYAYAAAAAAYAAARKKHYSAMSDKLIELIEAA